MRYCADEMQLIDSHCHLEKFSRPGELEETLARAEEAGVGQVITVGTSRRDWPLYRNMARQHPGKVFYSAGLHPADLEEDWEEQLALLSDFFSGAPLPAAVGETGLDYFRLPKKQEKAAPLKARQKEAFRRQLALAEKHGLPVIVHSRGAFADCVSVIDESGFDWRRVVFHCFGHGPEKMREINRRGARGSFTGTITFKDAEPARQAALIQNLDRVMIETDAPYLAPEPVRGRRNEPAFLRHTAEFCARLFQTGIVEFAAASSRNTREFFRLG